MLFFVVVFAAAGVLIAVGIRREKAFQQKAAELGLDYVWEDKAFEQRIHRKLPIFDRMEIACSDLMRGRTGASDYCLSDYSISRRGTFHGSTRKPGSSTVP